MTNESAPGACENTGGEGDTVMTGSVATSVPPEWATRPDHAQTWPVHEDLWMGPHVTGLGAAHCADCQKWARARMVARERLGVRGPTTARRHPRYRAFLVDLATAMQYAGGGQDG